MKIYDKITPEGTKDILFEQCEALRRAEGQLTGFFAARGFREVMTPTLEFYDVFYSNAAYFPQESMYKLTDAKGRLLVLRPDGTIPIARLTATRLSGLPKPLRLYYDQTVYHNHPSLKGSSDEVQQMGVELIGVSSSRADLEILETALRCLEICGVKNYRLEICPIGFFKHLIESLGCDADTQENIRALIESKNYAGLIDVLAAFGDDPAAKALLRLPRLFGGEEIIAEAEALYKSEETAQVFRRLRKTYARLAALGLSDRVLVDMGLVNQAEYYTGIIFRGYAEGIGEPLLSGGRYDHLLSDFGEALPATGFAVNIGLVARAATRSGEQPATRSELLIHGDDAHIADAYAALTAAQNAGVRAELSVFDTVKEAQAYATAAGIARLRVCGERTVDIDCEVKA